MRKVNTTFHMDELKIISQKLYFVFYNHGRLWEKLPLNGKLMGTSF